MVPLSPVMPVWEGAPAAAHVRQVGAAQAPAPRSAISEPPAGSASPPAYASPFASASPSPAASPAAGVPRVTASDDSGSVLVEAADSGVPVHIDIDPALVRPGGEAELSRRLLVACRRGALAALVAHRGALRDAGVDEGLLSRLGLPSGPPLDPCGAGHVEGHGPGSHRPQGAPSSWLVTA